MLREPLEGNVVLMTEDSFSLHLALQIIGFCKRYKSNERILEVYDNTSVGSKILLLNDFRILMLATVRDGIQD